MKLHHILFIPAAVLLWTGCLSTGPSAEDAPSWITSVPEGSGDYYIGISGSHTGLESEDRDLAYEKALKNLASAIYTEISSSTTLTEKEDSAGYKSSYENNIETSVASNLANLETVDSYYSDDLGYWVYLRLSHAAWDLLVEQRAREMRELAEDLFYDIFPDSLTELKVIGRGMESFYRLYSGKPIKMELLGQKGSVDTILILRAEKLLGEMAIEWDTLPGEITKGKQAPLTGQVKLTGNGSAASYENPGTVTLVLSDDEGREIRRFQTERDGRFELDFTDRENSGSTDYILTMESPYGEDPLTELVGYRLPAARQTTQVKAFVLPVKVESDWENRDLESRTLSFFKNADIVEVAPWTEEITEDYLVARVSFRKAPANDYGMIISYATLYLTLISDGEEITLWKSDEIKDAGLTADQSFQRSSEKLFDQLGSDGEIRNILLELN